MATINGTNGKDRLFGTSDYDVFNGYNGDDEFFGSGNRDTYYGGAGVDTVNYGSLKNGFGFGLLKPGVTVYLNQGYGFDIDGFRETFYSIENIIGSNFNDKIWGNDGENTLQGGYGNDELYGEGGADTLLGGGGNDLLHGGRSYNTIDGGSGIDTVSYAGCTVGVDIDLSQFQGIHNDGNGNLDQIYGVENVTGTDYNDHLIGDAQSNVLKGGVGGDWLEGRGGADVLDGGAGLSDWASYSNAATGVRVDLLAPATNTGEAAGDTFVGIENLLGSGFDDVLLGDDGVNSIDGGKGGDSLDGRGGGDLLYGKGGSDALNGGAGSDTFYFHHLVDNDAEQDVIWDFEVGIDHIGLGPTGIDDWTDLLNGGDGDYMEQVGNNVVIHTNAQDIVTLLNVQMSSLTNADFLF